MGFRGGFRFTKQLQTNVNPKTVEPVTRRTVCVVKDGVSTAAGNTFFLLSNSIDEGAMEDDHEHDYVNLEWEMIKFA